MTMPVIPWPTELLGIVLVSLLSLSGMPFQSHPGIDQERQALAQELEGLAAAIRYQEVCDVLYDRLPLGQHGREYLGEEGVAGFVRLREIAHEESAELLVPLLQHRNPKVRTLAMVILYLEGNPKLLPEFKMLTYDAVRTFPAAEFPNWGPSRVGPRPPPTTREQTVGEFARGIVGFYMRQGGYDYLSDGFDLYWKEHEDRDHCLGWFRTAMCRASQGRTSDREERRGEFRELRAQIDSLETPYREWVLLFLGAREMGKRESSAKGEAGCKRLVRDDELLAAARTIGADGLMGLLRGEPPAADPGMRLTRRGRYEYHRVCRFVLRNAAQLLRSEDADELLALARRQFEPSNSGVERMKPLLACAKRCASSRSRCLSAPLGTISPHPSRVTAPRSFGHT